MASRRAVHWLQRELPELVGKGVISSEVADRLRAHYGAVQSPRVALPLFGVLGSVLVGLGITLLIAHNWDELSRLERTVIAFAVLVAAQVVAAAALLRWRDSVAWSEGAAAFLMLASGVTIGLIAQIYHLPGDFGDFLWTWLLVGFALPYVFDSRVCAGLYLVGACIWLAFARAEPGPALGYWVLLGLALPYLWVLRGRREESYRTAFLAWIAVAAVGAGALFTLEIPIRDLSVLLFATVFAGIYAYGRQEAEREPTAYGAVPAHHLGALGIAASVLVLSFVDAWSFDEARQLKLQIVDVAGSIVIIAGFSALALRGAAALARSSQWHRVLAVSLPAFAVLGLVALRLLDSTAAAALLMNAYGLALGIATTFGGVREASIGGANAGMLLVVAVVTARFVDEEWSYVARGLAFIALGVLFLIVNWRVARGRRGGTA